MIRQGQYRTRLSGVRIRGASGQKRKLGLESTSVEESAQKIQRLAKRERSRQGGGGLIKEKRLEFQDSCC